MIPKRHTDKAGGQEQTAHFQVTYKTKYDYLLSDPEADKAAICKAYGISVKEFDEYVAQVQDEIYKGEAIHPDTIKLLQGFLHL